MGQGLIALWTPLQVPEAARLIRDPQNELPGSLPKLSFSMYDICFWFIFFFLSCIFAGCWRTKRFAFWITKSNNDGNTGWAAWLQPVLLGSSELPVPFWLLSADCRILQRCSACALSTVGRGLSGTFGQWSPQRQTCPVLGRFLACAPLWSHPIIPSQSRKGKEKGYSCVTASRSGAKEQQH